MKLVCPTRLMVCEYARPGADCARGFVCEHPSKIVTPNEASNMLAEWDRQVTSDGKTLGEACSTPPPADDRSDPVIKRPQRIRMGQPETLGEFRRMTGCFSNDAPLMVRNGPLPTLFYHISDGQGYIEIEIPDAAALIEKTGKR